jgi:gliding motility-associated-like protein
MDHNSGASTDGTGSDGGSLMSLYVTSAVNTTGTVTIADGSFSPIKFSVFANQVTIVTIPPAAFLDMAGISNKGIHIVTLKPVAIYAHIYAHAVSGATLLLPVSTLGKDYYSINFTQKSNAKQQDPAYSVFLVIATEDNTTVQITPSQALIGGYLPGGSYNVQLNKGQVYQGLGVSDLTGTKITSINSKTGSCTKIAVFSGSSKIDISCNDQFITSDNLFQQVYPTSSWGKSYVTVPLANRNYDVFRIVLSNPAAAATANVTLNGTLIAPYDFGAGYYQFNSQQPNVITADQPIQVVQYAVSQGNTIDCGANHDDLGDPEMIYLNPLEQTLDHVTLYSTGNFQIDNSYINVVIKTAAAPTFMLDGKTYKKFKPVPGNPIYSYAQISVQSGPADVQVSTSGRGTHTISAGDGFNAIAYGFGEVESYGYAAGTNLKNLTENITLTNPTADTLVQANGCLGVPYQFQLTLPYQTTNIVWDFKNGATYTDSDPKVIAVTTKEGQTLYHYEYYKSVTYNTPGDTSVTATVFNPVASDCGNTETVEFDFNIAPPPVAKFAVNDACLGDSTLFIDNTDARGSFLKTWLWDFGDGTTSTLENPLHFYTKTGTYKVVLTATNVNGCGSNTSQMVTVVHKAAAAFSVSVPDCAGKAVTITDKSTSADGNILEWIWDYGDGTRDTLGTGKPFTHIYANIGAYTISLIVVSGSGCLSTTVSQVVNINTSPVVDFSLPDVCLTDTYAQFTDKSTIADNTEPEFTYLWDFGDLNASETGSNTSAQKNPTHKYSQAAVYNVTLTVTSKNGCSSSKTQAFTVNGDVPSAKFAVENAADLCSMDDVVFDDKSTVNFGSITKMVWYFDYNNNPADTVVFRDAGIPTDRKFRHNYGMFNTPLTKSFTVRLDVYSGITCTSTTQQNITINANPIVTLSPVTPLCQSAMAVQIIEDKNGFTGAGLFTGPGVSSTGLFNPLVAGPGNFTINYTFTASNGCTYSTILPIQVYADPAVSAGKDTFLLEGGQVTIPATASGDGLTYQWTPATGLNHDNVLNPVAGPANTTTYTLVVTNANGCTAASTITINVLKFPIVPNAFTPNGDGINDTWDIKYLTTYPNNTVNIFNRYGQKVFSSVGYAVPWDGTFNGAALPSGTYYYIIEPKNGRKAISGSVTIIR